MNPSEKIAYDYLKSLGYLEKDILYNHSTSPDFITVDGKWWEVKKVDIFSNICFTYNQLELYNYHNTNIILVFNGTILTILQFYDLKDSICNSELLHLNRYFLCVLTDTWKVFAKCRSDWIQYRDTHIDEINAFAEEWLKQQGV
jgi:hypothetical protein